MNKSLKIVFVGNGNLKFAGLRHFGYDTRIFNGLVRNGHCIYWFSDRDEVRQASPFGVLKDIGRKRANEKLLQVVDNIKPDAIVLAHVDTIFNETFQEIRRRLPSVRIGQVNVDPLFNPTNRANLLRRSPVVDATFVTTGGPALEGVSGPNNTCYFIPNFSDSSIDTGTAFASADLPYDVACFMHADTGKDDEVDRLKLANGIVSAIPGLRTCYGGFNGGPSVRGTAYLESLAKSAMGLNLSKTISNDARSTPETRYLYSSDRIAHFMGNGCLVMTQDGFALQEIYAADEVIFFQGLPDLTEKVRFYKENPAARQKAAQQGWRKAHEQFETTIVMKYVLERLLGWPLSRTYAWPVQGYCARVAAATSAA